MKKLFFTAMIVFFSLEMNAAELYQPMLTTRCLGMGGTCASHIRGYNSLFLNPAALARVEGFDLGLLNANLGASSPNATGSFDASSIDTLYGSHVVVDVNAISAFVIPNFGFGVYNNLYVNMTFGDPTFPTFNMKFIQDYGYAIGGAWSLGSDTSFGVVGRRVLRWGGHQDINVATLAGASASSLADSNFQDKGVGYALDLGLMTTLNNSWRPTLSAVWKDVGVTTFSQTAGTSSPPSQQDNLILGMSLNQEYGFLKFTHAIEYKFATMQNTEMTKKLHLGTEASLGFIDIRAGFNQGYTTYGLGLDLWFLELDVATYASEMGAYAGQDKSDGVSASLTLTFNFDQSFKLSDREGKKRRLKQRR